MRGTTAPAAASGADVRPGAAARGRRRRSRPPRPPRPARAPDRDDRRASRPSPSKAPDRRAPGEPQPRAVRPSPRGEPAASPLRRASCAARASGRDRVRRRRASRRAPGPTTAEPVDRLRAPRRAARGTLTVTDVRRLWPEVLEEVKGRRRFTWILLSQNAHVAEVRDGVLLLAMAGVGARDSFAKGGSADVLRDAIIEVLGVDLRIETMVDPRRQRRTRAPVAAPPDDGSAARAAPPPRRGGNRPAAGPAHPRGRGRRRGGRRARRDAIPTTRCSTTRRDSQTDCSPASSAPDHRRGGSRRIGWPRTPDRGEAR